MFSSRSLEPTPVFPHKLHCCTFCPALLVLEGQKLVTWKQSTHTHTFDSESVPSGSETTGGGFGDGLVLTRGPATSWSVESGPEEVLGGLLLGARGAALLHRRHRVGSINAANTTQSHSSDPTQVSSVLTAESVTSAIF